MLIAKDTSGEWQIVHADLRRACDGNVDRRNRWTAVLSANDVDTVQDWIDCSSQPQFSTSKYPDKLVAILNRLKPAGAPRGMCAALVVLCPRAFV